MDLIPLLSYAALFAGALLLVASVVVVGVVASARPWLLLLPFIIALFWVSNTSFGRADAVGSASLLSRGAGLLVFPVFLWSMLLVLMLARFGTAFRLEPPRTAPTMMPLTPWFAGWALLLLGHVAAALLSGVSAREALAPNGFSFVVWMWALVALMLATVNNPRDARLVAVAIIALGTARALFGLVRFVALRGDPANAYANRQGLSLRLTFFDINDSLVCLLAMCLALVLLYRAAPPRGWLGWQRVLLWAAVVLPLLCIVLSFRRTAWVGTVLALFFVLLQLPRRARWRLVLLGSPIVVLGISYAAYKRLSQLRGSSGGFFYDLMPRQFGAESSRLLELKLAFETFLDHPLFGVGSWGGYRGWRLISWQTEFGDGAGAFLHSGVLHLMLKTGLVGTALLVGTVLTLILAWRRMRRTLAPAAMPLAVAGFAGLLFVLPDWLLGTPVPQLRTMMMTALCIGLPFVAQRSFAAAPVRASATATVPQKDRSCLDIPAARRAAS